MQDKTTHERRQHAVQVASVITVVVLVGWVATLGVRLASHQPDMASGTSPSNVTQLANVINGMSPDTQSNNSLEVATTTVYTGQ